MIIVPKPAVGVAKAEKKGSAFLDPRIVFAAGLFVAILLLTYGIDLSPGLF
jgi:preprotein translocase subunit Sec61beta